MKKIYKSLSILAFVAVCNNAMAQGPTITSAAMPQLGFTYNSLSDTVAAERITFSVTPTSGTAQTWNYTTEFVTTFADPTAFVAPTGHPGASSFPTTDLAANIGGNWVYFISGASGLFIDGANAVITGTTTAVVNYNPNETLIPVPFTYTSTPVNNIYAATFTISVGVPATVSHRANRTIMADAFGSLTTPAGTYPNTLRLKSHEITSDSIFVFGSFQQAQYDTTTSYTWMQNTQDAQLMTIDLDHTGAVTKASYLQSFSNDVATISQPSASFNLFPNPASDMAYFTYENKTSGMVNLTLIDLTGKQIAVLVNEEQSTGKQKAAINVAALHLPKGLYFLQLNSNNSLQTIKLSIN